MTLVCFAVKEEAAAFKRQAGASARLHIVVTGMGRRNAQQALRDALASFSPKLVLSCGFAGGLDPALPGGAVVFDADAEAGLGPALLAAGARPARFHCHDRVAATAAEKGAMRQATGADAVEMESGAIRAVCRERNIPSATVRVILDTAGEDLPIDFNALMSPDYRLDGGKLARALLTSPGAIPGLLRLQRQTRAAGQSLARVLAAILGNFN
jgi:adenosylhomocysteine nucleosidase